MQYIALRTSGVSPTQPAATVYATWDLAASAVRSLTWPLTDDVIILVQGGQTFGSDGLVNELLADGTDGNGHSITVQTDPGELSTPATIIGRISVSGFSNPCSNLTLIVKKLFCYGTYAAPSPYGETGTTTVLKWEDCVIVAKVGDGDRLSRGATSGWIKSCTFAVTSSSGGLTQIVLGKVNQYNNIILTFSDSAVSVYADGFVCKNNTLWNYGTGSIASGLGTWSDTIVGNPNLLTAVPITSKTEDPALIIARPVALTASSSNCIDNADAETTTSDDIIGNSRS